MLYGKRGVRRASSVNLNVSARCERDRKVKRLSRMKRMVSVFTDDEPLAALALFRVTVQRPCPIHPA